MITKERVNKYIEDIVKARLILIHCVKLAVRNYECEVAGASVDCEVEMLDKNLWEISYLYKIKVPEKIFDYLDKYDVRPLYADVPNVMVKSVKVGEITLEALVLGTCEGDTE